MSKQPPLTPTASAVGPCPTIIQIVGRPGTGSIPRTITPPDHPLEVLGKLPFHVYDRNNVCRISSLKVLHICDNRLIHNYHFQLANGMSILCTDMLTELAVQMALLVLFICVTIYMVQSSILQSN